LAVIFDVGGVLADDMHGPMLEDLADARYPAWRRQAILDAAAVPWRRFSTDEAYTEDRFWTEVAAAAGLNESVAQLKQMLRETSFRVFWQSMAVADRLRKRGYLLGILSNHAKPWFEELTTRFRLFDVFEPRISIASYQIGAAKPEDRAFTVLLERIRTVRPAIEAAGCIFIDNKQSNVEAATKLRLQGIQYSALEDPVSKLVRLLAGFGVDAEER
jgi:FMN phosphatase YigB (HAD superfamily)